MVVRTEIFNRINYNDSIYPQNQAELHETLPKKKRACTGALLPDKSNWEILHESL